MKIVLSIAVCLLIAVTGGDAGQNLPAEAQYLTRTTFRKINPPIEEDWTDYMQELAGEFTTCGKIFENIGHWEVKDKLSPSGKTIGGLVDYVPVDTTDRTGIDAIARQVFDKWISTFPFNEQIKVAEHFGCSIAPGCPAVPSNTFDTSRGYAVIGCGFIPSCPNEGCLADAPPPEPLVVKARALTRYQYEDAERIFRGQQWDRTHLLEDLSGVETDCTMIGSSTWTFSKALGQARLRDLDVYGRFGYALNTGTTPEPMMKILRDIHAEEMENIRQQRGNQFGCSIIADCFSNFGSAREQMFVVVSCIFSKTQIDQSGTRSVRFSRLAGDVPARSQVNNANFDLDQRHPARLPQNNDDRRHPTRHSQKRKKY